MKKKMSYLTLDDLFSIASAKKIDELLVIALAVFARMPQPISWVGGPLSSGGRSPEENRERMKKAIVTLKECGVTVFNWLVFQKRAERLLAKEFKTEKLPAKAQEKLLDKFYAPVFSAGYIKKLYLLPRWERSSHAVWQHAYAHANKIPITYLTDEFVRLHDLKK